ncbi:hypothetical protein RTCIAT899_PB00595 (plasmid) [Rhizobium tropici CIAT 899]|uniref:Uncharacterized protein n=1 Tax=Rhizobium lusitanum TaxID=293958 RepID=A0A1C3X8K7_9HYPH|nr:hypothetical protein RTCIAT899_PB00595 [Rhizobium tropici CIAT 899]MBB4245553.1 hypothetical protein [Rhizobium tropici]MBB6305672.1 hypothetical protein [Rhizobium leucaenae]MBB6489571.1 hypothetical protein [Rhizobium lusitanum]MBB5596835.1 hypothetical protein [Rhizobium tropici]
MLLDAGRLLAAALASKYVICPRARLALSPRYSPAASSNTQSRRSVFSPMPARVPTARAEPAIAAKFDDNLILQ